MARIIWSRAGMAAEGFFRCLSAAGLRARGALDLASLQTDFQISTQCILDLKCGAAGL
jgi:hypothetical protein